MLFHNSTMGNLMVSEDKLETKLLQLFAHQKDQNSFL